MILRLFRGGLYWLGHSLTALNPLFNRFLSSLDEYSTPSAKQEEEEEEEDWVSLRI